jgi:glycosyltransferase involved in cell wall biosynthesis
VRILVLTSTFPRWPADREPPFVFELCRRLAAAHEVHVIAPHCAGAAVEERLGENLTVRRFRYAPQFLESLAYEGGILEKLRRAPWRHLLVPFFLLAELLAALRAVRRERPDVIHAHWIVPQGVIGLFAAWAASGGKRPALVCTSHGADLFALRGRLAGRLKALVARRAAALTVVSAAMKPRAMQLGARAENVRVMPMGVDAQQRFFPQAASERSRSELLFVGRLVRKKGVAHLLRAHAAVREQLPEAELTVIGSGPLEEELRRMAGSLNLADRVCFAGAIPNEDLARYYRRAAALVVPSVVTEEGDQEGLGLVIAEALACECPVVASDLPAIRDVIEDGVTGLLARQGDERDLAEKIVRMLRDPSFARGLAHNGRTLVLERFDWRKVGFGYEKLLFSVAGSDNY